MTGTPPPAGLEAGNKHLVLEHTQTCRISFLIVNLQIHSIECCSMLSWMLKPTA